jgi:hypothetical protein
MVKDRRRYLLAAVLLPILGWALLRLRAGAPAPAAQGEAASGRRTAAQKEAIPEIGLERLNRLGGEVAVGDRDIFAFDERRLARGGPAGGDLPTVIVTPPPSVEVAPPPPTVAPSPPPARINLKYVGIVESERGARAALFVTERNEVLVGQAGDVVAHRYKVVKIGLESVDMQEVGTDRVQRIPFVKLK